MRRVFRVSARAAPPLLVKAVASSHEPGEYRVLGQTSCLLRLTPPLQMAAVIPPATHHPHQTRARFNLVERLQPQAQHMLCMHISHPRSKSTRDCRPFRSQFIQEPGFRPRGNSYSEANLTHSLRNEIRARKQKWTVVRLRAPSRGAAACRAAAGARVTSKHACLIRRAGAPCLLGQEHTPQRTWATVTRTAPGAPMQHHDVASCSASPVSTYVPHLTLLEQRHRANTAMRPAQNPALGRSRT